jgi:hypothetical protein
MPGDQSLLFEHLFARLTVDFAIGSFANRGRHKGFLSVVFLEEGPNIFVTIKLSLRCF